LLDLTPVDLKCFLSWSPTIRTDLAHSEFAASMPSCLLSCPSTFLASSCAICLAATHAAAEWQMIPQLYSGAAFSTLFNSSSASLHISIRLSDSSTWPASGIQ
jgi:hypothetical protein